LAAWLTTSCPSLYHCCHEGSDSVDVISTGTGGLNEGSSVIFWGVSPGHDRHDPPPQKHGRTGRQDSTKSSAPQQKDIVFEHP
jgi:hypothetical protein